MLVSVIVPVFNVQQFLENCLNSIIKQTYSNLEIILVDDGSTDNSLSICKKYSEIDHRIKVFHQENKGVCIARNKGIEVATGEYIMFVDSDDTISENMIEKMMNLIEKNKTSLVISGLNFVYNNHTVSSGNSEKTRIINQKDLINAFFEDNKMKLALYGPYNKLYSSDIIKKIKFEENIRIGEDLLFVFQYLLLIKEAIFLDLPLYDYYKRETSVTGESFNQKKGDYVIAAKKIKDLCQNNFNEFNFISEYWYYVIVLNYMRQLCAYPKIKKIEKMKYNSYISFLKKRKCKVWGKLTIKQKVTFYFVTVLPVLFYILRKIGFDI